MVEWYKLQVNYENHFGRRRPKAVITPSAWPLELVFEDLVGQDVGLVDRFIADLDGAPLGNRGWYDDLTAVYFHDPKQISVVDIDFEAEYTVTISRTNMRSLMMEWRAAIRKL